MVIGPGSGAVAPRDLQSHFVLVPVPVKNVLVLVKIFFQSRSKFLFSPGPGPGLDSMSVKKCTMVKKVDKLSKNSDF
jgi:hypothetical protein